MSIADEIIRLQNAKDNIRVAVEKRGIAVDTSATIDDYPGMIESAPYAVKGKFTPEADTSLFSISGLPFAPQSVYIVCNELEAAKLDFALVVFCDGKGKRGMGFYYRDGGSAAFSKISENSALKTYSDNGYEIDYKKSSSNTKDVVFKAGYTYDYYITGGNE